MLGTVSLIGTALALFLILVMMMTEQIKVVPYAPEHNRDRWLIAQYFAMEKFDKSMSCSGPMSYTMAEKLYGDLPQTEMTTYFNGDLTATVNTRDSKSYEVSKIATDDNYWRVLDFTFLAGRPFNAEDVRDDLKQVIVSEYMAKELFGSTDVVGREIFLDRVPHTIIGVVKDVPSTATKAYAEVWTSLNINKEKEVPFTDMSGIEVLILANSSKDFPVIRDAIKQRRAAVDSELASEEAHLIDNGAPFTQAEMSNGAIYSNVKPDFTSANRQRWITYLIILIVPAINLSSMNHSQLARRQSEIGVRRAFGASRSRIFGSILLENFTVTVVGGIIGLGLAIIYALIFSDSLFATVDFSHVTPAANISLFEILHWSTVMWALIWCFLLNVISTGLPAIQAARCKPVDALAGQRK